MIPASVTSPTLVAVSSKVGSFLNADARRLLVDGMWVEASTGETFEVFNPATGAVLGRAAAGDKADVDLAVRAARRAFERSSWANMSPFERSKTLLRIAEIIDTNSEELAQIECLNYGALLPIARAHVAHLVETFIYYAGWPTKIYGDTNPGTGSTFNYTLREPLGVCGAIAPWNGPLVMAGWKIAPALAFGNTVVLKPAEQTPLSAIRLGELLLEADLPPGVVNIISGFGETAGAAMTAHLDIDKISFTGSTAVGRKILAASQVNFKRVTLELGGKSPNIIFPDANLDTAAAVSFQGFFLQSGQQCVAASRMLVHQSVYDEFVDKLASHTRTQVIGDPFDSATTMGPLISQEQFDRVSSYFDIGRANGATVVAGGNHVDRPGYFVEPTIFTNVNNDMRIAREEIFGPVTTIIPFKDEDEAIRIANDTDFGLAAGVWTKDISRAHRVTRALRAGTVWINTYGEIDLVSPLGGYKQSGQGREHSHHSMDAYTEIKSVFSKTE